MFDSQLGVSPSDLEAAGSALNHHCGLRCIKANRLCRAAGPADANQDIGKSRRESIDDDLLVLESAWAADLPSLDE